METFVELGDECSNESECILSDGNMANVTCAAGTCTCMEEFRPDVANNICNSGEFLEV
jgi:EB module